MISESQTLILHGYLKTYLFIYLAVLGLHCCACAFSSCGKRRLLSSGGAWASHCSGFPYCRACVLGAGALLPLGIWNLPGPGIKPMSPVLAGGFLTIGQPGSSGKYILILFLILFLLYFTLQYCIGFAIH